ncbi:MAG: hypothetical protein HBSAPP03_27080 [Phycisphaerae bacterium]|nr:MAG: hypothetical protein HBSAPP03_27080 [Phycisphaerae bacterium]
MSPPVPSAALAAAPVPGFAPFSLQHALCVAGFVLAVIVLLVAGRRAGPHEPRARRVVVILLWLFIVVYNAYYLWPSRFDPAVSLPLQLCDLALLAAPLALAGVAWARPLLYFWGLLLSSQGFISPTVEVGPAHARFWLFWISHAVIVGGAVYDLVVLRYRPRFADFAWAYGAGVAYILAMFEFNRRTGFNYGFVGSSTPGAPTLLDHLGPWPGRVLWMILLGGVVQFIAWILWPLAARLGRTAPTPPR